MWKHTKECANIYRKSLEVSSNWLQPQAIPVRHGGIGKKLNIYESSFWCNICL